MSDEKLNFSEAKLSDLLKTKRQRLFAIYYVENGGKHKAAAEQAGYSTPGVEGCRLIKNEKVQKAVARYAAIAAGVAGETRDTILARMINRANVDPGDYFETVRVPVRDAEGEIVDYNEVEDWKKLSDMTKAQRQRIKKIADTQYGRTIEFHDPSAADRDIARLMGLEPKEENSDLTPEDAATLIASALGRMDSVDGLEPERTDQ